MTRKYEHSFTADIIKAHGEWCLSQMMGGNNSLVPSQSAHIYADNERRVRANLAENESRRP
jgi:hypothetical protein